ncbi:uncharacterized protein LOC132562083 [Ylistrum balloti]|uniref:uncharacterized protein LOC132562083 n=1 Tax=Ylistrum balloti TaxID=509963 RepID=UPI002905D39C|nr:uncharacterized protein LOC132562083 [Ylistrum balloti]
MAAVMTRHEIGVRDVGYSVQVPDDYKAKMMFYLQCICDLINLDGRDEDFNRLTDFGRYYLLTESEIDQLTILCLLLSPDLLDGKCLFLNEEMCGSSTNKFFELSAVDQQLVVSNDIMIGGTQTHVKRIMCYKREWIMENYMIPMTVLKRRLQLRIEIEENAGSEAADDCCCVIL